MATTTKAAQAHQFYPQTGGVHAAFVGNPEDCGYTRRENGTYSDVNGNTGELRSWNLDPNDRTDRAILVAAYAGDDAVKDFGHFEQFLTGEAGLSRDDARTVIAHLRGK